LKQREELVMKSILYPLVAVCILCGVGCAKKNEFQAPPPPAVTVQHPVRQDVVVYHEFPGRVVASDTVDIRARVRGYLKSIEFKDGQRVEKGDLLFTIEPDEYIAAANSAEARVKQAEAALKLADARLTRINQAWETKAVSEVDKLTAEAEQQSAQAGVLEAKAALDNAKLNLTYTEIRAPLSGRIGKRALSVGNIVGNGESTLLTRIVVEAPIYVYFTIDERSLLEKREIGYAERSLESIPLVKLKLADGSTLDEEGKIIYRDPEMDPETGTLQARAVFSNEGIQIVPGLYGKIMVPDPRKDVLLVPELAIQRDLSGPFVLVVTENNQVASKYIKKGPLVGSNRIVEEGLTPEDRIIVEGIQRARPGITVRLTEKAAE